MKRLGYLKGSSKWIRPYYYLILKYDKHFTTQVFCLSNNKNNVYTIFGAINAYEIDIDNPKVNLIRLFLII